MSDLASRDCVPCRGGVPALKGEDLNRFAAQLGHDWQVVDEHHLSKTYAFANFEDALHYVIKVGEMAEEQGHHPDIYLAWGKARVDVWTHKIDGLTESDFVFAAKAEELYEG